MKAPLNRELHEIKLDEVTTHFIPFGQMSSSEKYAHVMDAHGYRESYYWPDYPGQVRPHPTEEWLKIMHEDDHAQLDTPNGGSWMCQHTHTKSTTNP